MLEHRSGSLDGPDNTCRQFEYRIESSRGRKSERLDRWSIFLVSTVHQTSITRPTKLTSSRQNFYIFPTLVRPSVRHLLAEDRAAQLYLHLLRRLSRGFTRADCYADYCVSRFDGYWRRRSDDSCANYCIRCGDSTGKVSQLSLNLKGFLADEYAPEEESIKAYW
jgi:hypothetical protein